MAGLLDLAQRTAQGTTGDPGTAYDVLWAVWNASGLGPAWQAASAAGGARGEAADRDLDAVVALFDAAARFAARLPPGSPWLFLDSLAGQEIPGDTLADRAPDGEAVRILTAHRAKGLEWDVVVVAGVQEGTWPDLRMRSSLLGMDELVDAAAGQQEPGGPGSDAAAAALISKLLDEERRLFYVAVTRARRSLTVTAVGGTDSDERPSRFLAELAGDDIEIEQVTSVGRPWLSLPALTAELRRAAADPGRPWPVRQAAAAQLARLAGSGVRGAHPRQWYALTTLSDPGPVSDGVIRLSPSQVESFTKCGLRWLLEAAAGAGAPDVLRHLGTVIHAAAVLAAHGTDEPGIGERIDEIWHHLDFGSAWYSEKQRELAHQMVTKFLAWHRRNPRELVAVEEDLRVRIGQVEITGRVDRLERDAAGGGVIVDLKTGSSRPADAELDRNPQLGVYQLAMLLGAFERFGLIEPGGAELVQIGKAGLKAEVRVQRQRALGDDANPDWAESLVETVATGHGRAGVRRHRQPGLPGLPGPLVLPGPSRRRPGDPVNYTPAQLARLLGVAEPTAEQAAVIAAPPQPLAVIAGAGSGKSETMAARLVWLVANGLVRPERVLGLTFTRKAAGELGDRVRARLDGLRRAGLRGSQADPALDGEPVVSTYHAYAARLVADHALREAMEPTLRLITPAVAWQLASRVVAGYGGPMDAVTWSPPGVTAAVLMLAGELAEHLRTPAEVTDGGGVAGGAGRAPGPAKLPGAVRKILDCQRTREQLLPMVAGYARAKADREVLDHGDQVALAARIAHRHPEVGGLGTRPLPGRAAR